MTVVKRQYDDIIQELQKRVRSLENEIRILKEMRRPAVPIYDYNDPPVGFEGQLAVMTNAPDIPIVPTDGSLGAYAYLSHNTNLAGGMNVPWDTFYTTDPTIFKTGDGLNNIHNAPGDDTLWCYGIGWYLASVVADWPGFTFDHACLIFAGGSALSDLLHGNTLANHSTASGATDWTIDHWMTFNNVGDQGVFFQAQQFMTANYSKHVYMTVAYVPTPQTLAQVY